VPERALDGPAMIAASDLVLSAGGTMNREAAALGVPAWSVFTGPAPFIDMCLEQEGRLRWARTEQEADFAWWSGRPRLLDPRGPFPEGLDTVLDAIYCHLGMTRPIPGEEEGVATERGASAGARASAAAGASVEARR
jgi:hypothetical protein